MLDDAGTPILYDSNGRPLDTQPVRENNPAPNTGAETNVDARNGDPLIPRVACIPATPPTVGKQEITCKPEKDWRDKTKFWFEIGGIVLLGVYTAYTIKMYCANRDAAIAATSASNTAANALRASVEQFRVDERAWIEIEPPTPALKVPASDTYGGALFTYDFFLKNVGKTAAFGIAVRAPRAVFDGSLSLGDNKAGIDRMQKQLKSASILGKLAPSDEVILLSERNSRTLGPGVKSFSPFQLYGQEPRYERYRFLIGRIDYYDAFSIAHWNTFCFFIDHGGALRYCREGNEEDQNPENEPSKNH
jgi:hypothetical protein